MPLDNAGFANALDVSVSKIADGGFRTACDTVERREIFRQSADKLHSIRSGAAMDSMDSDGCSQEEVFGRVIAEILAISERLGLDADDVLNAAKLHRAEPNGAARRIGAVVGVGLPIDSVFRSGNSTMAHGSIELDARKRTVTVQGEPLNLTGYEFSILEMLLANRGSMLAKEQLIEHLYRDAVRPSPKIIDVFVCKIRAKLADLGQGNVIQTIRKRGYVIQDECAPMGPAFTADVGAMEPHGAHAG